MSVKCDRVRTIRHFRTIILDVKVKFVLLQVGTSIARLWYENRNVVLLIAWLKLYCSPHSEIQYKDAFRNRGSVIKMG